jgi:hypothetical protein
VVDNKLGEKMKNNQQDKHALSLGKLVANLQSLEFLLRGFLSTIYDADSDGLIPDMPRDVYNLPVGSIVPENYITNYLSLGKLIDAYNEYVNERDTTLKIDRGTLVELRDALAHGRVSGTEPFPPLKILKFDQPRREQVRVAFSQTMDEDWFRSQILLVLAEVRKVYNSCKQYAPSMVA